MGTSNWYRDWYLAARQARMGASLVVTRVTRETVVRSKPEDRKVSGLRHFCLDALEQRAV